MSCIVSDFFDGLDQGGRLFYTGNNGCVPTIYLTLTDNGGSIINGAITPSLTVPVATLSGTGTTDTLLTVIQADVPCKFYFSYILGEGTPGNLDSCATEHTYTLEVIVAPSAGTPIGDPISYCTNDNISVSLYDLINGETPGGAWTIGGSPVATPYINPSVLGAGTFSYVYTVSNSGNYSLPAGCTDCEDSVTVNIEIELAYDAGEDNPLGVCS